MAVTPIQEGPCTPWIEKQAIQACEGCTQLETLGTSVDANIVIAGQILFEMLARQWTGDCAQVLRPCCQAPSGGPWEPALVEGRWYNRSRGNEACVQCGCGGDLQSIDLGYYPVTEVTEVKIDGAVLAASAYRLDDWRYLTRLDGDAWPSTQDLTLPATQAGTWSVSITHGRTPPEAVQRAAAELACELTKHCDGDERCQLPLRVTAISRQGVSYSIANVMDVLHGGNTGLYYVDLVLQAYNPNRLRSSPRVQSAQDTLAGVQGRRYGST